MIRKMMENAVFLLLDSNRFSLYTLIFPTSQSKRASGYITNQNSCDVTAVFPYSHLNTAIDQCEWIPQT